MRRAGLTIAIQMMPGLLGDTRETLLADPYHPSFCRLLGNGAQISRQSPVMLEGIPRRASGKLAALRHFWIETARPPINPLYRP